MRLYQDKVTQILIEQAERQAKHEKRRNKIKFCKKITHVYNPIGALTFVALYWAIGLKNAQFY